MYFLVSAAYWLAVEEELAFAQLELELAFVLRLVATSEDLVLGELRTTLEAEEAAGLHAVGEATDEPEGATLVALDVLNTTREATLGLEGPSLGVIETVEETTLVLEE